MECRWIVAVVVVWLVAMCAMALGHCADKENQREAMTKCLATHTAPECHHALGPQR